MVSRKDSPGYFDGMERAQPGEPVFTLRGNDALAASLVSLWCERRREAILAASFSDERRAIELIQVQEAEEIGWAMNDWRKGIVDSEETPKPQIVTYSGNELDATELEAKIRHDALKGAASTLHNALAEVSDTAVLLDTLNLPGAGMRLREAVATIKTIAEIVQPKRASYAHRHAD